MSFSGLPIAGNKHPRGPLGRVCIATHDVAGPYPCGGVGAAYYGLAVALARGGHDVTLLYVSDTFRRGTPEQWRDHFAGRGIRFVHLPQPPAQPVWYARRKEASYDCYRWLAAEPRFDVIHSHEWLGLPYYSLVAKRLGLAFADTTICIETHGPMRWSRDGEQRLATLREDLIVDFMERRSVALADVVASPSRYMLEWMKADGWTLPERSYVAQNVLETPVRSDDDQDGDDMRARSVDELVFFGRLDRRKGVALFCDIVDRLDADHTLDFTATFLGSSIHLDGKPSEEYVLTRARHWRRPPRILTDKSREEAFEYLSAEHRLAVMPSRTDNLPCTVHECVQIGIPFLASDVGGTAELVDPADRDALLCAPEADRFASRLSAILAAGQRPARAAVARDESARRWLEWHAELAAAPAHPTATAKATTKATGRTSRGEQAPAVSVCIAHFDRPHFLEQMLTSLERQTCDRFEVIVADDGSRKPETAACLDRIEQRLDARGWKLLRGPNRGPALARHAAAERARGRYLLFLDDDDVVAEHAVETLLDAAEHAGVDALVPFHRSFLGDDPPDEDTQVRRWFLPLGPALAPSLIFPEAGGAMILVDRDAYFAVGGFPSGRNVDEDWELMLTLVERGYDVDVLPEPLLWYRDQEESRSRADNRFERTLSRVRLFERMLPIELRDLAALALAKLAGAADSEGLRRLDRVRQVLDRREQRKAEGKK